MLIGPAPRTKTNRASMLGPSSRGTGVSNPPPPYPATQPYARSRQQQLAELFGPIYSRVFNERLVNQIIVVRCLASPRIKNFFFNLCVDLQSKADLLCEVSFLSSSAFSFSYSSNSSSTWR